jgi:hypothetical protein
LEDDATNPQNSARGGYVSFVARLWVGEDGKLIRGMIEDVHTGTRMALDLSELVTFLQASLAHSPQGEQDLLEEGEGGVNEELLNEEGGEEPQALPDRPKTQRKDEEGENI